MSNKEPFKIRLRRGEMEEIERYHPNKMTITMRNMVFCARMVPLVYQCPNCLLWQSIRFQNLEAGCCRGAYCPNECMEWPNFEWHICSELAPCSESLDSIFWTPLKLSPCLAPSSGRLELIPKSETKDKSKEKKPRKQRIPKGALQILRDAVEDEMKSEENSTSERKTDQPKTQTVKKKPKTHFRKSKKPGRA